MMSVLLEDVLSEKLNEELSYSKYDYKNKDTDSSNSIVLLYNFEYIGVDYVDEKLEHIGCADETL